MSGDVVVHYEGSPASRWALTWAAVEASRRGARLHVLVVVDQASLAGCPGRQLVRRWEALRAKARRQAAEAARLVRALTPGVEPDVSCQVGLPVAALVAAS